MVMITGKSNVKTRYMGLFHKVMTKMHINEVRKTVKYTNTFI